MAASCINFAIFGHNHRVLQTFLSTITQPNQCDYGAGVSSRTSKLPFQSQNKLKSKTQRPILGLGFESSCFTWGFIPSMVICFERNCSVLLGRDYDNRLLRSQQERNNIDPSSVELVAD